MPEQHCHEENQSCSCHSHAEHSEEADVSQNFFAFLWASKQTRLALIAGLLIIPGVLLEEVFAIHHIILDILAIGAILLAGYPVFRSAWKVVTVEHDINANVLMTIAALGALFIQAFTEAGAVMVLFAIGEALEEYTSGRSRQSIRKLMEVAPNEATRLVSGRQERVAVADLQIGDTILVKPGERLPMDGKVLAGLSWVNQAPITGESRLIEKGADSQVFASSINGEGTLEIEITHLAADNTISRVIQMVEEAQEKRAPAQRFVDRFARYYTPAVVLIAFLTAVLPPLFMGQPFWNVPGGAHGWLYRGLALLVVGCPCALVISTPVSIISAISNAARHGILIKGGAYLEELSRVKAIAFDKTGTLTEGKPSVVTVRSAADQALEHAAMEGKCIHCDEVIALAHAVEQASEHPLAQAVLKEAALRGATENYPAAVGVTAHTGQGVSGMVNGRSVLIGSHTYFDNQIPHDPAHCQAAQSDSCCGYTPLMVSEGGQYVGTITVADTIRPTSRQALAELKKSGLQSLVMLSGDQQAAAEIVGRQVGVTDVRAGLLPEDKVQAVRTLQQQFGSIAMVGDGINDAPALATANVGIAIGAAMGGTGQAMETADVALMSDDLVKLPFAFRISQAAMRTVKTNVIFALGVKLVFFILVLLGLGTMWMAVFADVGTTLLVTLYGMRLLRMENP